VRVDTVTYGGLKMRGSAKVIAARFLTRAALRRYELVLVALLGAVLGVVLLGSVNSRVGPVDVRMAMTPTLSGGTHVNIPPLGALELNTHSGPGQLSMTVNQIDPATAQKVVNDPAHLERLGHDLERDARSAVTSLVVRSTIMAVLGAALLSGLVLRRRKAVLAGAGIGLTLMVFVVSTAAATWNPRSLVEPKYTGLLSRAPSVVGDFKDIVNRFGQYRSELAGLVTNVTKLYGATSTLPTFSADPNTIRVLHVSDIHLNPVAWSVIEAIADEFKVDVIVDTGDLVDHGTAAEDAFANDIARLKRPYVFIKGNHDSASTVAAVKRQPNAHVLDYSSATVGGLTFYGAPDPRFTPDRSEERDGDQALQEATATRMANALRLAYTAPDVTLVHMPWIGEKLAGTTPLVLSGDTHKRDVRKLDGGTLLMVQGSTGGAGLRALEHDKPTPVECSVLYFDRSTRTLQAYDDISIGGLGLASATIDRHLVEKPTPAQGPAGTSSPTPDPARTQSRTPALTH
jgi:predicted MPP superfamily phosphohydrolase